MGVITAKELKQKTGEMMRRVKRGERLTVTYRGTPIAALLPLDRADVDSEWSLRPLDETWRDIDRALGVRQGNVEPMIGAGGFRLISVGMVGPARAPSSA